MGFTQEELMELQKEVELEAGFKPDEEGASSEDSDKKDTGTEDKKEGVKDEGKEKEEGAKESGNAEEGKKEGEVTKSSESEEEVDDARELRESSRKLQAKLDRVTNEYSRLSKILKDKGLIDEDEEKSRENQDNAAKAAYDAKMEKLSEIVEVMSLNPKYEDVSTICSQKNFDDMFAAMARFYVNKQGGEFDEVLGQIERQVWGLTNPYRYMYDMIKKYHPNYAKKEESANKEDSKKSEEVAGGKKKEPAKAAPSLQDLPGGDGKGESGGWTSERIDNLDEDELFDFRKKHPDIYNKYLEGSLQ